MCATRGETSHALRVPPIAPVQQRAAMEASASWTVPRMARFRVPRVAHFGVPRLAHVSARRATGSVHAGRRLLVFAWRASKPLTFVASVARVLIEAGAGTQTAVRLRIGYGSRVGVFNCEDHTFIAVDRMFYRLGGLVARHTCDQAAPASVPQVCQCWRGVSRHLCHCERACVVVSRFTGVENRRASCGLTNRR